MPAKTTISKVQAPGLSLLSYLQPSASNLWLRVSGTAREPGAGRSFDDVFKKIGPIADGIPVELMFDQRQVISVHHLILQADQYRFLEGGHTGQPLHGVDRAGVTNTAVESLWGRFVEGHCLFGANDTGSDHASILLPTDPDNRASICKSLFFCNFRHLFCHPLCPHCGSGLTLCRDDTLLASHQLSTYNGSTERFLYCPQCNKDGGPSAFYTPTPKEAGQREEHVFSVQELVAEWGRLTRFGETAEFLPCQGCDEADTCFGSSKQVTGRMAPFRFFPFYMMLQPASLMPADDYLALLSGSALVAFQRPSSDGIESEGTQSDEQAATGADESVANETPLPGAAMAPASESLAGQGRIRTILSDILAAWPDDQGSETATTVHGAISEQVETDFGLPVADQDGEKDGDVEETVVLTSASEPLPAPPSPAADPDGLDRTVVVSPPARQADTAASPPVQAEPDLEKTVVLSPAAGHAPGAPPAVKSDPSQNTDDLLDKTVVLPGSAHPAKGDPLDRTVVVSPGRSPKPPAGGDRSDSGWGDDGELDATIVLKPADRKKGKPSS